jgi:hypothetical protein
VGSLVLVPSAASDEVFAVRIVAGVGRDPADCVPPIYGPGCIVARRTLSFVSDTALTLPVALRGACDGVRCGPRDTCVAGRCRSAAVPAPAACVGARGCDEGVLGPPDVSDCAALGQPADASCWDVSASFSVANYTRGADGLHVFGERAVVGRTSYAFLDGTADRTRTSSKITCGGVSMDESAGFDIERHFDTASGAHTITVSGKSVADCGRPEGSQCAGTIALNPTRGFRITGGHCNVAQGGAPTKDALGRPVHCQVEPAAGTVSWQAGPYCGTCCACPDATAYVDISLSLVR